MSGVVVLASGEGKKGGPIVIFGEKDLSRKLPERSKTRSIVLKVVEREQDSKERSLNGNGRLGNFEKDREGLTSFSSMECLQQEMGLLSEYKALLGIAVHIDSLI